jgi:hypothetical protein
VKSTFDSNCAKKIILLGILLHGAGCPALGKALTSFPASELEKHVGKRITVRGTWGTPKLGWSIWDKKDGEVWIHDVTYAAGISPKFPVMPKGTPLTLEARFGTGNWFQFGESITATGILYKYTKPPLIPLKPGEQPEGRAWTHYFFDERKVTIHRDSARFDRRVKTTTVP